MLRDGDREVLQGWIRSTTVKAGLVQRARIVTLAADGVAHVEIARRFSISRQTVINWRQRYEADGIGGLYDGERSGRPRVLDRDRLIVTTLTPPPKKYGVTHWSSRLLADHLSAGYGTVAKVWRDYGVQPWRTETFKFSTDLELVAKVTDIVGLYLEPPDNAIVLCVDTVIRAFINGWNPRAAPFVWIKTPTRSSPKPVAKVTTIGPKSNA